MVSIEARRAAARKWDSANLLTVSCRVRKEIAIEFKHYCFEAGSSPHQELKKLIDSYIAEQRQKEGF